MARVGGKTFDDFIFGMCTATDKPYGDDYQAILAGGPELVPDILRVLEQPTLWTVRALRAAAENKPDVDAGSLEKKIHKSALSLRILLIEALGEIGDRRAVPLILELLENPASRMPSLQFKGRDSAKALRNVLRLHSIDALGILGDERAIPALLRVRPDDYLVEFALMEALAGFKQVLADEALVSRWLQDLKSFLSDPSSGPDRLRAIRILGKIGSREAITLLAETLADTTAVSPPDTSQEEPIKRICDYAAEALERIGTPEALDAVRRWREDNQARSGREV